MSLLLVFVVVVVVFYRFCQGFHSAYFGQEIRKMEADGQKLLFPTPDLRHTSSTDFDSVYEPAEDSFLMLDALEQEYDVIKNLV